MPLRRQGEMARTRALIAQIATRAHYNRPSPRLKGTYETETGLRVTQSSRATGNDARRIGPIEQTGRQRAGNQRDHGQGTRGQVMRKMSADSLADLVRMAAALDLPVGPHA